MDKPGSEARHFYGYRQYPTATKPKEEVEVGGM